MVDTLLHAAPVRCGSCRRPGSITLREMADDIVPKAEVHLSHMGMTLGIS